MIWALYPATGSLPNLPKPSQSSSFKYREFSPRGRFRALRDFWNFSKKQKIIEKVKSSLSRFWISNADYLSRLEPLRFFHFRKKKNTIKTFDFFTATGSRSNRLFGTIKREKMSQKMLPQIENKVFKILYFSRITKILAASSINQRGRESPEFPKNCEKIQPQAEKIFLLQSPRSSQKRRIVFRIPLKKINKQTRTSVKISL